MWSGPRNLSTALMRSLQARGDCAVVGEPLYAHYMAQTRIKHPGFEEVIASHSQDWPAVRDYLLGPIPSSQPLWYQKHMTHHLLDNIDRTWLSELQHAFLIRSPELVLASYAKTRTEVTLDDLGFLQQSEIFEWVSTHLEQKPIVIDSEDLLKDPPRVLSLLCAALKIPYTEQMLSWQAGARAEDGVWAKYWYHNVESSTGFQPWRGRSIHLNAHLRSLSKQAQPHYEALWRHRLQ